MFLLWISYVISVLFLECSRARLFSDALWSPAGKGLTSWLSFVRSKCEAVTFPLVFWVRYRCLIVLIPDLCPLSYFLHQRHLQSNRCKMFGNKVSESLFFHLSSIKAPGTLHSESSSELLVFVLHG